MGFAEPDFLGEKWWDEGFEDRQGGSSNLPYQRETEILSPSLEFSWDSIQTSICHCNYKGVIWPTSGYNIRLVVWNKTKFYFLNIFKQVLLPLISTAMLGLKEGKPTSFNSFRSILFLSLYIFPSKIWLLKGL